MTNVAMSLYDIFLNKKKTQKKDPLKLFVYNVLDRFQMKIEKTILDSKNTVYSIKHRANNTTCCV